MLAWRITMCLRCSSVHVHGQVWCSLARNLFSLPAQCASCESLLVANNLYHWR
jgi:hypothetical protein